jgi:Uma2 family endonuclease
MTKILAAKGTPDSPSLIPQLPDRPGWIPAEIPANWDPNPYAYQTEEELMPAGGLHGQLIAYIVELLRHVLVDRGLMLLIDTFLLYRDERGVKQRIAPDLLLMPARFPPPSAYDLDEEPPPLLLMEVTSPKSRVADMEHKSAFYMNLGVPAYLAIDAITSTGRLRRRIELHLWRRVDGEMQAITPDEDDGFSLPEMGVRVLADGQCIRFIDLATGERLLDSSELAASLVAERQQRSAEHQARIAEHQARQRAEAELARLQAELRKLRGEE